MPDQEMLSRSSQKEVSSNLVGLADEYSYGPVAGTAPEIDDISNSFWYAAMGTEYAVRLYASVGDTPITWSLVISPSSMTINAETGEITWSVPFEPQTSQQVRVKATNAYGYSEKLWTITIGLAPYITSIDDGYVYAGENYRVGFELCHGDPPITWTLAEGPVGMQLSLDSSSTISASGQITTSSTMTEGWISYTAPTTAGFSSNITIVASNYYGTYRLTWSVVSLRALICTGPEYDSGIDDSFVEKFLVIYQTYGTWDRVEISIRASNQANDPEADSQWSEWMYVNLSNVYYAVAGFGLQTPQGRYKQVRIRLGWETTMPYVSYVYVSSVAYGACITSGQTFNGTLELIPEVKLGNSYGSGVALQVGMEENQTYFTKLALITTDDETIYMPAQRVTVSRIQQEKFTWEKMAGSAGVVFTNNTSYPVSYNMIFTIYADRGKTRELVSYEAVYGSSDLQHFMIGYYHEAESRWLPGGIPIAPGARLELYLWPEIGETTHLVAGVPYWLQITYWTPGEDEEEYSFGQWWCEQESPRWLALEPSVPGDVRELLQWQSSSFGKDDIRVTDGDLDNLNPIVTASTGREVLITYEKTPSNAAGDTINSDLYASAFWLKPSSGSYMSGAHSIEPVSDPAREDVDLDQKAVNHVRAIDRKDLPFISFETLQDNSRTQEFVLGKERQITVHRRGKITAGYDLTSTLPEEETDDNIHTYILEADLPADSWLGQAINHIKVSADHVKYYVTYDSELTAVVGRSDIVLETVGVPSSIAIRLKNESGSWSSWMPFNPEIGDYTAIKIPWTLTTVNGSKTVTIQIATPAGLGTQTTVNIIADYSSIQYNVYMYKPLETTALPPEVPTLDDSIFSETNLVNSLEGVPVAAIRKPEIVEDPAPENGDDEETEPTYSLQVYEGDYIFIEIKPDVSYLDRLAEIVGQANIGSYSPIYDFEHQGWQNYYGRTTQWNEASQSFRGYIEIKRQDDILAVDGLALITPHFQYDDTEGDVEAKVSSVYSRDQYNLVDETAETSKSTVVDDPFADDRDDLGLIIDRVRVRPTDDPFFVFGEPNYRLNQNEQA